MSWYAEALSSLKGSWLILRLKDDEALAHFNFSESGFWRSFSAFIPAALIYLLAARLGIPAQAQTDSQQAAILGSLIAGVLNLALQWVAWPLVMVPAARILGLARRYGAYIIVYNWSSVLVLLVQVPPQALYYAGLIGKDAAGFFSLVLLVLILVYRWRIARLALEAPALIAAALVLLDMVISVAIFRLFM